MIPVIRTRWRHVGGDVIDCFDRTVPLARAAQLAEEWNRLAEEAQARGDLRIARVYKHDADALSMPASLAYQHRVSAGWLNPFDADYAGDAA